MAKILITGGAGYIGSHTALELLNEGYEVVVYDNLCNSSEESLKRVQELTGKEIKFYEGDVLDGAALEAMFRAENVDAVIHCAALKAVGESVQKPLEYYQNNITGTLTLMDVMNRVGVKNIVFSSSATVYGSPAEMPITEACPKGQCTNPYGWTKSMMEQIMSDVQKANPDWNVILLRYFNPVGAHPSALLGELPRGVPNNLIPYVTQTAIGKRECLTIFGDDYPTPDGTCLRDYIDVVDLAKAHVAAVGRMVDGKMKKDYEIFNVGTGRPVSVLEIVRAFEKANGVRLNYRFGPRRAGDITAIWADPSLANRELGWTAQRTLEDTMKSAWEWELHLAALNKK